MTSSEYSIKKDVKNKSSLSIKIFLSVLLITLIVFGVLRYITDASQNKTKELFVTTQMVASNLVPVVDLKEMPAPDVMEIPAVAAPGEQFELNATGKAAANSPQIAEWTREGSAGNHIILTGNFGPDVTFDVYRNGIQLQATSISNNALGQQAIDSTTAIVQLPGQISWDMFVLWPRNNNGYGKPVFINRTEAYWMQDLAAPGQIVSLYGRNLAQNNQEGNTNAYVYLLPEKGGKGQFAKMVQVNPYRLQFQIPETLPSGNYYAYAHNGHGGNWGWAERLRISVMAKEDHLLTKKNWGSSIVVKKNAGGDAAVSINQATKKAGEKGNTVQFNAGVYSIDGPLDLYPNTRWKGVKDENGKPATIIRLNRSFSGGNGYLFNRMGDLNMNLFEDIIFESNGHKAGATDFIDLGNPRMLQFSNCIIDSRYLNTIRWGHGKHVYVTNSTLIGGNNSWGNIIFTEHSRQLFIDNCTFKFTNDCAAAIINKNMKEVSATNNLLEDLDNSRDNGWGKGRFWSSLGNGGSSYHQYFANNTGKGLGVRMEGENRPDPNSGEVLLWEANGTIFKGLPVNSTINSITFNQPVKTEDKELYVYIIKGNGMGQVRRIINNNGKGKLEVQKAWLVPPDASSICLIGPYVEKVVVYKNSFDAAGKAYITSKYSASCGVELYGGCFDFIVAQNTFTGLHNGIVNQITQHAAETVDPNAWNYFTHNVMKECKYGIITKAFPQHPQKSLPYAGILSSLYRNNKVIKSVEADALYYVKINSADRFPAIQAICFEGNEMNSRLDNWALSEFGQPVQHYKLIDPGILQQEVYYQNKSQ